MRGCSGVSWNAMSMKFADSGSVQRASRAFAMSSGLRLPDASHRMRNALALTSGPLAALPSARTHEAANQNSEPVFSTAAKVDGRRGIATTTSSVGVTSASEDDVRQTASALAKRLSPRPPSVGGGRFARIGTVMSMVRSASLSRGIARTSAASPFGAKARGVT